MKHVHQLHDVDVWYPRYSLKNLLVGEIILRKNNNWQPDKALVCGKKSEYCKSCKNVIISHRIELNLTSVN